MSAFGSIEEQSRRVRGGPERAGHDLGGANHMTATVIGLDDISSKVGEHLGYSEWFPIDQARVNLFADATEDHQWIHVDPERAKSGPFGQAIAHGYLTLSLAPVLLNQVVKVDGTT